MYKIAVVDDNELWCLAVEHFFSTHGLSVSTFNDAYSFLREVNDSSQFDVALVDFSIPPRRHQKEMDGPDLIHKLKHRLSKPPLCILTSAYFSPEIIPNVDTVCPEADAYLGKAEGLQETLNFVMRLLSSKKSTHANEVQKTRRLAHVDSMQSAQLQESLCQGR